MKREEALAKFCEEEQNYIDGIKAGFLVKIQENANDIADCLQKVFSDIRTAVEEKGKKDIMFIHFSILRIDFLNHIYRFLAQVMDARWYMDTAPVEVTFLLGDCFSAFTEARKKLELDSKKYMGKVNRYDIDNLLKEVEKSLRKRKRGAAVRLELNKTANLRIKKFLSNNLDLSEQEIFEINGPLDATCFFKFASLSGMWPWLYEPFVPQRPLELPDDSDLFSAIRKKDILLHHPYESFDPVVKLVSDAASDPKVLAIKQTLYRVSGNSPIVAALARAAENGKQVTVLVELKARFDEENNIIWARRLEQAGCHVIYGLVGLKTHAKIILIVRKEADGIKRYVHLGTGNYNDNTAKLYTDMGLLTANDQFGSDASAFFNLLSGYSQPPLWNKLVMAPLGLRDKIYELIDNEIAQVKAGNKGHIIVKMNSLIDQQVIQKLYEASIGGVQVELIVRGICGLRAGVEGISENITVRSIVGRQLEHSRIFWFANGGEQQLYLSSADWMPRNLNDRVELFFPVESEEHIKRIKEILDLYLRDNVGAHMMQSNGTYRRVTNKATPVSAQSSLYEEALLAAAADKIPMEVRLRPMYSKDSKE